MLFLTTLSLTFTLLPAVNSASSPVSLQSFAAPLGKFKVKCLVQWRHTSSWWGRGSNSSAAPSLIFLAWSQTVQSQMNSSNHPVAAWIGRDFPTLYLVVVEWMKAHWCFQSFWEFHHPCCLFRLIPGLTSQNKTFKAMIKTSYALKPQLNTHKVCRHITLMKSPE